jgi:hypothetical protein
VILLKPHSDPFPGYIPVPLSLFQTTRLFFIPMSSREVAVETHSNRKRCRCCMQATDKITLTYNF